MLKNKTAIVTGATRGIGNAIAKRYAENGANVLVSATRQDVCDDVAAELQSMYGVRAIGCAANVSIMSECQTLVSTAIDAFGAIDILVNNAGITKDNLLLRMSEDEWQSVLNVNLNSVFNMTKSVLRPMLKKKAGSIINVSSVIGIIGNPGQANYAASKAGIIGFSKSIAREIAAKGITVNVIAPGFIDTDMTDALPETQMDTIIKAIPQKRMGMSIDIANAALFLGSDLSSYITGHVLNVDGGMVM